MLVPGQPVPLLSLPRVGGGTLDLQNDMGPKGALLVVYRGLHCPLCIKQIAEMTARLDDFKALDVALLAMSTDNGERAEQFVQKADCASVPVGYDLPLAAARNDWGLWISPARPDSQEPAFFAEPGLFYINGNGTLQTAWVQSAPFARPGLDDILSAIKFQQEKQYPPRGTHTGSLPA